jgi:hypothetical protein
MYFVLIRYVDTPGFMIANPGPTYEVEAGPFRERFEAVDRAKTLAAGTPNTFYVVKSDVTVKRAIKVAVVGVDDKGFMDDAFTVSGAVEAEEERLDAEAESEAEEAPLVGATDEEVQHDGEAAARRTEPAGVDWDDANEDPTPDHQEIF